MGMVWMEVTMDELQLPLVVAGSKTELAWLCKVPPSRITSRMQEARQGKRREKYIAVEVEDGE